VAVPDEQLPVLLPDLRGQDLAPGGVSPLAGAADWSPPSAQCAAAGAPDTTRWTVVDSSWYFLRYCSPHF